MTDTEEANRDLAGAAFPGASRRILSSRPEFVLAVAACKRPVPADQIDAALARHVDWKQFIAVVERHRIAGLVCESLLDYEARVSGAIPAEVLSELRQSSKRIALRSVAMAREAVRLTNRLEDCGIFSVALKGAPLSMLAYGDMTVRHSRDLDLLIAPGDTAGAHEILRSAGYRLKDADDLSGPTLAAYMRNSRHLEYQHPGTGIRAELHWRLYDNPYLGPRSGARFGSGSGLGSGFDSTGPGQMVSLGSGLELRTLSTDDLLLYLCAHGAVHGWSRLKWLADVAALLVQEPEGASGCAARLLARSGEFRLRRAVVQGLALANEIFDAPLPPDFPRTGWAERRLIQIAWQSMMLGDGSTELYDDTFASTNIRLSQFLLSFHPGYLFQQLKSDFTATSRGPSRVARANVLTPLLRTGSWAVSKMRQRKRVHARGDGSSRQG